jgi:Na+/H+ antiporter NhaD/arsenite permease-like protein
VTLSQIVATGIFVITFTVILSERLHRTIAAMAGATVTLGAGFGGNGTSIGSTANVVTVSLSEKTRTSITTRVWLRSGLPVMLATCAVASLMFTLLSGWMQTR